jgi:carbamoyl-phosphate synthase large subunit
MDWKGKKVFVSGGAGVIGSYLVNHLLEKGAQVFVGDLKPCPISWHKQVTYREGDLNEIKKEELERFQPEVIFHLAATFERSVESEDFWSENVHHNVKLSHHLLDCLKSISSVKKYIFASSYLVYDPGLYLFQQPNSPTLLSESSQINPRNLCGASKMYHEKELEFAQHFNKKLSVVNARIFRSYGINSRDIISRWIHSLSKNEPIQVYAPEGQFDYVYAGDVAEGLIRLSEYSGVVNIGSGHARSVSDVVNILKSHFPKMVVKQEKSNILYESSQADIQRLKEVTGWTPTHSLEDGIVIIKNSGLSGQY